MNNEYPTESVLGEVPSRLEEVRMEAAVQHEGATFQGVLFFG